MIKLLVLTISVRTTVTIRKSQHRPIAIKIKTAISPHEVPFRRQYNIKKADCESFVMSVDMGSTDIVPTPDNYVS